MQGGEEGVYDVVIGIAGVRVYIRCRVELAEEEQEREVNRHQRVFVLDLSREELRALTDQRVGRCP